MNKLKYLIAGLAMVCVVFILMCGCQSSLKGDDSDSAGFTEDNQNEDSTVDNGVPSQNDTSETSFTIMFVKLQHYGSTLNVRDNPSMNGNIIGKMEHGDSVEVISMEDGWATINYNDGTAYVSCDYLVQEEPSTLKPPTNNISPDEVYINVYKEKRSLELWKGNELIGEYRIGLGFDTIGHKEREGDGKTPEGSYYVCVRNPNSRYYLSLGISYPGIPDAERGLASNLITQSEYDNIVDAIGAGGTPPWNTALGGEIMIHGSGSSSDWTAGCIALDNDDMDILWEYCSIGTKVNIYP